MSNPARSRGNPRFPRANFRGPRSRQQAPVVQTPARCSRQTAPTTPTQRNPTQPHPTQRKPPQPTKKPATQHPHKTKSATVPEAPAGSRGVPTRGGLERETHDGQTPATFRNPAQTRPPQSTITPPNPTTIHPNTNHPHQKPDPKRPRTRAWVGWVGWWGRNRGVALGTLCLVWVGRCVCPVVVWWVVWARSWWSGPVVGRVVGLTVCRWWVWSARCGWSRMVVTWCGPVSRGGDDRAASRWGRGWVVVTLRIAAIGADWEGYDGRSRALAHQFAIADTLHLAGEDVPARWEYRPGIGLTWETDQYPDDMWRAAYEDGTTTVADMIRTGDILARYVTAYDRRDAVTA